MEKKLCSVKAGTFWTLIEGLSEEHARKEMAEKMGHAFKPWVYNRYVVSEANDDDKERYAELADVGPRKRDGRNPLRERLGI